MVSESVRRFALLAPAPALLSKLHFNNVASGGFGNVGARFQHVQCVCSKRCGRSWAARNGGVGKRSVGLHFHVKHANSEEKRPSVTIDGRSQTACFLFLALLHSQGGCKQGACRYQQCGDCNDWCIAVTRMGVAAAGLSPASDLLFALGSLPSVGLVSSAGAAFSV